MTYSRFSPAEFERRNVLARGLMERENLQALVIFGNSGMYRHNQANVYWLTNYLDLHHNYLVLPVQGEPALLVGLINHVPNARLLSVIEDTRWGTYEPAAQIAAHLRQQGVGAGRVGLVGVNATFGMGMPYQHFAGLTEQLPEVEWADVTRAFAGLRTIKSSEEFAWLQKAAEFTDAAVSALEEQARPGLTEFELVGIIEGGYRSQGGFPHLAYLRSMPMDAPTACVPAQNVTGRRLEKGDVIITEISASYWGYSGQIQRPIAVGCDPTPEWSRLFETGVRAYEQICRALAPGATEGEVIRSASLIGEAGYRIYDDLIHGFGVDIQPPIIDQSCCRFWEEKTPPPAGRSMARDMAIVVQPNPITPDERLGLQVGDLTRVTDEGAVSLQQYPLQFVVAKG
jgi:Xaa-Pro aminopeptidase